MSEDEGCAQGTEPVATGLDESSFEDDFIDVDIMEASTTAFGSVRCEEFDASGCAIANAAVAGDAEVSASVVGVLSADGLSMRQSCAAAMMVSGDVAVSQGGASLVVARHVEIETGGAGCVVAAEASLARTWVGFMAARNATISDDSRVIIDTRAGLIIGALLFGGLGLLAVATYLGARRIAERVPHLPHLAHMRGTPHAGLADHMRRMRALHIPAVVHARKMPDLSAIAQMLGKLGHTA